MFYPPVSNEIRGAMCWARGGEVHRAEAAVLRAEAAARH